MLHSVPGIDEVKGPDESVRKPFLMEWLTVPARRRLIGGEINVVPGNGQPRSTEGVDHIPATCPDFVRSFWVLVEDGPDVVEDVERHAALVVTFSRVLRSAAPGRQIDVLDLSRVGFS
jgi:hypothetical protein